MARPSRRLRGSSALANFAALRGQRIPLPPATLQKYFEGEFGIGRYRSVRQRLPVTAVIADIERRITGRDRSDPDVNRYS